MVIVTFALPDEASAFTAGLQGRTRPRGGGPLAPVAGRCAGQPVEVVFTGVGAADSCRRRLDDALDARRDQPPSLVIGSGFAGGLAPALRVGDLVLGENYSDPALLVAAREILDAGDAPPHCGPLTTAPLLAETVAAKAALHAARPGGALAVDMETAWIAAACSRRGVPLLSLRVISDAADQPMPAPGRVLFDAARQRPRYLALPLWLLAHPGRIGPFARFVRGLGPARARLARALERLLAELERKDGDKSFRL